ncbi:MAG TPA: hypothetical protein VIU11_18015 [Nakamurella sp.]
MLLTSYHMEEAELLADRLAIMYRGLVVRTGTPAEGRLVPGRADHRHVATGSGPPLPALPGSAEGTRGGVVVRTADLQLTVSALLEWANRNQSSAAPVHGATRVVATGAMLGLIDGRPAQAATGVGRAEPAQHNAT